MKKKASAGSAKRQNKKQWGSLKKIALIGTYLPRQCGIATFTYDLSEAIVQCAGEIECWVIAMDDRPEGYSYHPRVHFEINQNNRNEYDLAADFLNINYVDAVCVQHEYGIFGGERGRLILDLLQNLKMPVVSTLHTVLQNPSQQELEIVRRLADYSDRMIVMTEKSIEFLVDIYKIKKEKCVIIPHGIHDSRLMKTSFYKKKFGVEGKKVILTFGLLSPSKGLEFVIDALPEIVKQHPDTVYMVIGATHPHVKAAHGEDYRLGLHRRAKQNGVGDHVVFHDRFLEIEDLKEFIGAADVYITPYLNEAQIVSGTLSYAFGMGKPVVSTPYWHAQELLAQGRGVLVGFRDSEAIGKSVIRLFGNDKERMRMGKNAYEYSRSVVWKEVGKRYLDVFEKSKRKRLRRDVPLFKLKPLSVKKQRLPEINLNHLRTMTDDTGMLQHARINIPNRDHGYCTDDNARALIVTIMTQKFVPEDRLARFLTLRYLGFLDHAFNESNGRFRNFMSYDRKWLDEKGSDDSHARAVWALGIVVGHSRSRGEVTVALKLFNNSMSALEDILSPRAVSFGLVGLHEYLRLYGGDSHVRNLRKALAGRLMELFKKNSNEDWPWLENILTYDNARIPQALLLSGQWMQDSEMVQTGIKSLEWLIKIQTDGETGFFSPVGNDGWYPRGGEPAKFDHQPLESAATIDACIEAFNCTGDRKWLDQAFKCFNWYLGGNVLDTSLYDHATGGCRDGLGPTEVNENQGAESTLSWLMSLAALSRFEEYNQEG